jgi:hypothetical protein
MAGFQFRETMSGSYHLDASPERERAMSFTIGARVHDLVRFARDRVAEIQGAIEMEGYAAHRPLRGTLVMDPIFGKVLAYEFRFVDDEGQPRRFKGQKDVSFLRLMETMTTLPGEIQDADGNRLGEARLRFDVRADMSRFLSSFRPLRLA